MQDAMAVRTSSTMCKWLDLCDPSFLQRSSLNLLLLFCSVNVALGPKEERVLITGLHTVCDIACTCCGTVLGWKYVSELPPQKG